MKHPIKNSNEKRVDGEDLTMAQVHDRNASHVDQSLITRGSEQCTKDVQEKARQLLCKYQIAYEDVKNKTYPFWMIAAIIEASEVGLTERNAKTDLLQEAMDEHYRNAQTSIVRATIAAVMESVVKGMFTIYKTDIPTLTQKIDLTMDLEAQRTIWDRVEMETKQNDDHTLVTFSIFNK